jgi:hypothetical protein
VLSVIPTSETAGTVTEASTSNGFSSVGTGSYTISGADTGTALMVVKLRTCLTSASKQCRSYSINLTLRRLDP